ncbi:MAG: outer membrane lipoprotein carrier protein LolA [Proteobacteria bacterium]|nr:outer membrane lipoprotein carrier protein LolA [Pseudomonadota bacterium]
MNRPSHKDRLPMPRAVAMACAFLMTGSALMPAAAQVPPPRPAQLNTPKASPAPPAAALKNEAPPSLERINGYLNGIRGLQADFLQIAPDGRQYPGVLYMLRPGRMRFEYHPPATLEVVSDGRSVMIRDKKMKTEPDKYFIGQTPLKFLLQPKIDVAKDAKLVDLKRIGPEIVMTLEDKSTFGGTSIIRVHFDGENYALREWTVVDAQGASTRVALSNVDLTALPDKSLFIVDEPKLMEPRN